MSAPPAFLQDPPRLGNQYDDDRVLRSYLRRALPPDVLLEIEPSLRRMGELAGGELCALQLADRAAEPSLVSWDGWGRRIERIEPTAVWRRAERLAAEEGVVAAAYDARYGAHSRLHQFALAYLFSPSTDFYGCPLAMTDGAARTLLESGNRRLIEHAVSRLTSRDPDQFWTSGQWMTESTGGSDVGLSRTEARRDGSGWTLHGHKWFTSAASSPMALTLARPEGNGPGGKGLALFYLETRREDGLMNGIVVHRLKEKLGTRKLPTAELTLDGCRAELVGEASDGVRAIAPMLNLTRTWNAVTAVALMRRGIALARDYARRRVAFGARLLDLPLHAETLADQQAELEGAFHLTFRVCELIGHVERGAAGTDDARLLRILTPLAKLTTARQAVAVSSEVLESFGGAGYVEDTGLPTLLRDAQVLAIWEGTTNVLALDALRAMAPGDGFTLLAEELHRLLAPVRDPGLCDAAERVRHCLADLATAWLEIQSQGRLGEASARRLALGLGRCLEVAALVQHAEWALVEEQDRRARAAALRLAERLPLPSRRFEATDTRSLADDEP